MPSHRNHMRRDIQILGEQFKGVHVLKDFPYHFLRGRHRQWFHDPVSDILIGIIEGKGNPVRTLKAIASGLMHDIDDFSTPARHKR